MKNDPTQSIARNLKILIWIVAIPSILFSALFVTLTVDHFSSAKRRATSRLPTAHPIRLLGEPLPQKYNKTSKVSLKPEGTTKTGKSQIITLRLINPSSFPVVYIARSQSNPYHLIKKKIENKWVNHDINWFVCGTSRQESVVINPNESILITVEIDNDLFPVKIGIKHAHGEKREQEIWSSSIELNNNKE